jgi:hypothetical protein
MASPIWSFSYLPLDSEASGSFRLVSLHPGVVQDEVGCELTHDTWKAGSEYEALSYAWGNGDVKKTINLNGESFSVMENLYCALSHIRYKDRVRTLWMDAICINQVSRFSELVSLLRTVSWVGEPYELLAKDVSRVQLFSKS